MQQMLNLGSLCNLLSLIRDQLTAALRGQGTHRGCCEAYCQSETAAAADDKHGLRPRVVGG